METDTENAPKRSGMAPYIQYCSRRINLRAVQICSLAKRYQVSDGKLLLTLQPDSDGWFVVTSPIDPAMITEARTIGEAFSQARDAFAALADSRLDPDRWDRVAKMSFEVAAPHRNL